MPGTAAYPAGSPPGNYPGERFGMPATGRGAAAGFGRRLAALTVDWLLGYLIAGLFAGPDALGSPNFSWTVMGVWFVLTAVAVAAFGITPGMAVLGIRVAPLRSSRPRSRPGMPCRLRSLRVAPTPRKRRPT